MYKIILDKETEKYLDKLNEFVSRRIIKKIKELIFDPFSKTKRLKNRNEFSLRIGEYRVLFSIKEDIINILKIGYRKNIYDK